MFIIIFAYTAKTIERHQRGTIKYIVLEKMMSNRCQHKVGRGIFRLMFSKSRQKRMQNKCLIKTIKLF